MLQDKLGVVVLCNNDGGLIGTAGWQTWLLVSRTDETPCHASYVQSTSLQPVALQPCTSKQTLQVM